MNSSRRKEMLIKTMATGAVFALIAFIACMGKVRLVQADAQTGLRKKEIAGYVLCIPFTSDENSDGIPVFFFIYKEYLDRPTLIEKELFPYLTTLTRKDEIYELELTRFFGLSADSLSSTYPRNNIVYKYEVDQEFRGRLRAQLERGRLPLAPFTQMVYRGEYSKLLSAMDEAGQ